MNINFHGEAVQFVRDNNCANHTPVELIERAMTIGGIIAMKRANLILSQASNELDRKRKESKPHDHKFKPIPIES